MSLVAEERSAVVLSQEEFASADPGWWLTQGRGLRVGVGSESNVRPDGTLAPSEAFVGLGEWAPADEVLMVLDVTSRDPESICRDRTEKPRLYAESGIPVYLLIDRGTREVTVHSRPDGARYEQRVTVAFGKAVTLPDPVGIELDTEPLKEWAR